MQMWMKERRNSRALRIKKIEPIDLPGSLVLQLEKLYHSTLRDFTVMIDKTNWTMYVEKICARYRCTAVY